MPSRLLLPARGLVVAARCDWATRPADRARGLIARPPLVPGEALILSPARQVHTFGMKAPIDVVFCDRQWLVIHVARAMAPRRVTRLLWKARHVIELPAAGAALISRGDRLAVEDADP